MQRRIESLRASMQFRVALETNHHSVPADCAGTRVTLKATVVALPGETAQTSIERLGLRPRREKSLIQEC